MFQKVLHINPINPQQMSSSYLTHFWCIQDTTDHLLILTEPSFQKLIQQMTRYSKYHQHLTPHRGGNSGLLWIPTYSIHQSAIQKMGALRECSNISVWLIYGVGVSKENKSPAYQKSRREIQRVFALTLQLRHSTRKVLNYQHPVAL